MLEDYESNLLVEVKFQTCVSNHLMKRNSGVTNAANKTFCAHALLSFSWYGHPTLEALDVNPCFELHLTHQVQKQALVCHGPSRHRR